MKFLFLLYSHEPGIADGGGFRKPWALAEALQRLGHDVHVIAPRPPFETPVPRTPFPLVPIPIVRPFAAYAVQFILGLFHRPDVVYFRSSLSPLPLLLGKILGAKTLMEVNGDAAAEARRDGRRSRARLIAAVEGFNARRADRVIALTEGLAETLRARCGAPPDRVSVLPSGTDTERIRPLDRGECRRTLGLPEDVPIIGFVGVFYRHQGVDTLLRSAPGILKERPDTLFLLIGDGPSRREWADLSARLGLGAAVRFMGPVPYDRLPVYLGALDAGVAPFHGDRGETSPLKVLDYCAAGRPVVMSALPCLDPLVRRVPGLRTVPPDAPGELTRSLLSLLDDPPERERLGRAGREAVVRHHDWTAIARAAAALMDSVTPVRWRERVREAASHFVPAKRSAFGVTAVVRVRDEEDWLELSVRSLRGFADRVVIGDNGSTDGTPAVIEKLRREFPGWVDVVDGSGDDIKTLTNRLIARAGGRWIVRWDGDFVAHTEGPHRIGLLREWLAGLPRRHFLIYLRMVEVAGDLRHQDPAARTRRDAHLWTASPSLEYAYDGAGFESPKAPPWYAVRRWEMPCFFHLHVKSDRRLYLNSLWKRDPRRPLGENVPDPDAAARAWIDGYASRLVPADPGLEYPALLKDLLADPKYRLTEKDGRIVGRETLR